MVLNKFFLSNKIILKNSLPKKSRPGIKIHEFKKEARRGDYKI